MEKGKLFVLDTNVVLHDSNCCHSFQEHDIVVPIELLSELDHFKKGGELINFNARDFVRFLDTLDPCEMFNGGAPLGPGLGKIRVIMTSDYSPEIKKYFPDDSLVDHQIINTVYNLSKQDKYKNTNVIFVSKDVNLRLKAKSLKLLAEDYETDVVSDVNSLYENIETISVPKKVMDTLYDKKSVEIPEKRILRANDFVFLNTNETDQTALVIIKGGEFSLIKNEDFSCFGIKAKNNEQKFGLSVLLDPDISLVTIIGKAGTGKTILALAGMLQQIGSKARYDQLLFTRNITELGEKEMGSLPGGVNDKLNPFMNGLYDNLGVLGSINENNGKRITSLMKEGNLIIEPLNFIRGRSLIGKAFIIDESQNLTPKEAKAIITRAGDRTKIIMIGDITQIDHPYLDEKSNGLSYVIEKMRGQSLYAHVVLKKSVRSPLAEIAGNLL